MAPTKSGRTLLVTTLAERLALQRSVVENILDELSHLAETELKRAGEFNVPGMVKLVLRQRQARVGRNPATGQPIDIPAKTVVKARIAGPLKASLLAGAGIPHA